LRTPPPNCSCDKTVKLFDLSHRAMTPEKFCPLAARLLRHPAVPYHEHAVRSEVEAVCAEHGLDWKLDRFGNVLVRLRTAPGSRPLVLAAHLDHPGFELLRPISAQKWLARFRGGVADSYFRPGTPLRLMPGPTPGRLGALKDARERVFEIETDAPPAAEPRFAVWELEDFAVRRQRIYARACDDLIGSAAVLATLIELKESRAAVHVIGALSRAEEVGFHGALALAASGALPDNSLVVSLETSRALPGVRMGQGVILRVGDRASIFDSEATRFLGEVAADLRGKQKNFQFQRALMGGGTCEATAYQEFGLQSAGVCIALGNYHNCGAGNQVRAEYVSLADACGMVELLAELARQMPQYPRLTSRLPQRLRKLLREAKPRLTRIAGDSLERAAKKANSFRELNEQMRDWEALNETPITVRRLPPSRAASP
jgi:putative aminopeptidase FrvX